jgi:Hyaluronan / mRNA binding family
MTRTARSSFPRAIHKDRSESKSGLDKSLRKNGAGMHNWGSLADERHLEFAAIEDEAPDFDDNESTTDTISSSQSDCM